MHKKFGEVRPCGFRDKEAYRQTNGQVNRLRTPTVLLRTMAAMEHDKQLYWITAYGGCLHSLWKDLGYMFQSILKSLR